jgi:hypothetical protein
MQDDQMQKAIDELGLGGLPPEEQEKILNGFGEVALKAATAAVLKQLSSEKQEQFAKLAEAGDASALKTFLDTEVPGHAEIVQKAVESEVRNFKEAANKN